MFRMTGKRIFRDYFSLFMVVVTPLCMVLYLQKSIEKLIAENHSEGFTMGAFRIMQPMVPYIFIVCMLLAYEVYYAKQKTTLKDLCRVYKKEWRTDFCVTIYLLVFITLITGILFVYVNKYRLSLPYQSDEWNRYFVRMILQKHTFVYLLAIMIGRCIAYIPKRIAGISFILFLSYFFGEGIFGAVQYLLFYRPNLAEKTSILNLWCYALDMVENSYYLISAEPHHYYRLLFWISITLAIYVWLIHRNWLLKIATIGLVVGSLWCYIQSYGAAAVYSTTNNNDSWRADQIYYLLLYYKDPFTQEYKYNDTDEILCQEGESFQITKYDMEFSVNNHLQGQVQCTVDKQDLEKYSFTLYHGYKIRSVRNEEGKELTFTQNRDWITVNNSGKVEKIIFEYEGYDLFFYATNQGIYLPANFEYYPVAGFHLVQSEEGNEFTQELFSQTARFDLTVKVKADYPVASNFTGNLIGEEKGYYIWHFGGEDRGIALMGSPYLVEREIEGVRVIDSKLKQWDALEQKYLEAFAYFREQGIDMKQKTYIDTPFGQYNNICRGDAFFMGYINSYEWFFR